MKTNFHLGWQKETAVLSQWAIYLILREGEKNTHEELKLLWEEELWTFPDTLND